MKIVSESIAILVSIVCLCVSSPLHADDAESMPPVESASAVVTSDDGQVRVTATIKTSRIEVAVPIDVSIVVQTPEGSEVALPEKEEVEDQLVGWNVLQQRRQLDIPAGDSEPTRLWRLTLTIETLRVEPRSIPPLEIRYRLPDKPPASWGTIETPVLKVSVQSVVKAGRDPRSFREIKDSLPPAAKANSDWPFLPLLSSVVVLLGVAAAAGCWLYRRSRKRIHPADEAKRSIVGIESEFQRGSRTAAETIVDLDQVVRLMIQSSLPIPATALSRDELIQRLEERSIVFSGRDDPQLMELNRLMETADQVKYAGEPFTDATAAHLIDESLRLVERLSQGAEPSATKGAR